MGSLLEQEIMNSVAPQGGRAQAPRQASPAGGGEAGGGGGQSRAPSSPQGYNKKGGLSESFGSFFRGVTDTVSFGFADEIGGFLSTVTPLQDFEGQKSVWESGKGFGSTLAANIAIERSVARADEEAYGKSRIAGQIGGAFLLPVARVAEGASGVTAAAKSGLVQGAAYGAGSGEGLGDRVVKAGLYGVGGAAAGGTFAKVGEWVGKGVKSLFNRAPAVGAATEEAVQAATDRVAQYVPEGTILGQTKTGVPLIGARAMNEAGQEAPTLAQSLIKVETVTGEHMGEEAAQQAAQTLARGDQAQRESLSGLQDFVKDLSAKQARHGDRAADITWENAPDVAARTGEWRLGSLGKPEDVQSLLNAVVRGTTQKATRSDTELGETALGVADRIGEDPEAVLAFAKEVAGKLGDADTAMMALRTVWARASQDITDFHLMNVDWDTASEELVQAAAERIYNLSAISSQVQAAKTGLGRALRSIQLPSADLYRKAITEGAEFVGAETPRAGNPLPTTRQQISDWFDLWGMTGGDPKRQADVLQGLLTLPTGWQYVRQSAANFFTASILSMPKTVALNIIGPGVISVLRNTERFVGANYVAYRPWSTPTERAAAKQVARFTAKAYLQTFNDIRDVFRVAVTAAERNHTIIGGGGQTFDARATYGPITENLLSAANRQVKPAEQGAYWAGNLINVFPKAFARVNNGLDEFAKRLAYQGEVRINAMVEAGEAGLEGQAFQDFVSNAMKNAYDDAGHAQDAMLLREAERTTMTSQVGEEGTKLRGLASWIQSVRADIPETRYILPVFNVPANGLAETLRRLPIARIPGINNALFSTTAKELAGEMGPVVQADAHGRTLLAGAFMMAGTYLNQMGVLTGAGPSDPTDKRIWMQTHQPYSIKIGDQWVDYRKYDILGSLLSIPATVQDLTIYHDNDQDTADVVFAGIGALTQWFKDRSSIQNAAAILSLGDDPTKDAGTVFTQLGGNIASGFIPAFFRGLVVDAGTNPYQSMRRSWMDYVESALPMNNVEVLRNVLGEPVRKKTDTIPEVMLPVTLEKAVGGEDTVLTELDRLYQVTGYGAGADTSSFSHGFFADKDVKLEDGASLYTHAMKARQEMTLDGLTLRQALTQLFKSEEYKTAVDGDTGRKLSSRGELSRGWMVSQVFQQFNQAIKGNLAKNSPLAREYMTAAQAKLADDAYLRDVSVEDLIKNPDLYRVKGLEKGAYEGPILEAGDTADLYKAFGG